MRLPLTEDVEPVTLDLQAVFTQTYQEARLQVGMDYMRELRPPLPTNEAAWVETLLREKGLR
jgi:hypothetical protein